MVLKFSKHSMPFIGSCFYRSVSEYDIKKSVNKLNKFPKEKFYLKDNEFKFVIVAQVVKRKLKIITVMTDLSRPISISANSKFLEVS